MPSKKRLLPDEIEDLGDIVLDEETDARVLTMEAEAEHLADELRVTMRWKRGQLDLVQRAADQFGMPYQTYIKHAATRQAVADLQEIQKVPPAASPSRARSRR